MISRNFWYARHDFPPPGDKLLIVPDDKNIHPGWGGYFYVMPCHCRFLCFIGKTNVFLLYYCCTCFYFFTPYI